MELLDKCFGSVCELDIIFNCEKAYFMDKLIVGDETQERSKRTLFELSLLKTFYKSYRVLQTKFSESTT